MDALREGIQQLKYVVMNPKLLFTILTAVGGAVEEGTRNLLRSKGQKKLQKRVNASSPAPIIRDLSVCDNQIRLTVLKETNINLENCQESYMTTDEANKWKALVSTLGGETAKTAMTATAFNGLLKCDVSLKDLCRIKDNPEAMRGFVMSEGKISKQASLSEAGIGNVAPLLVYQYIAAVTSQYYQHIITEKLISIDNKLDSIISILSADDRAKLKVAYNRFVELSKKTTYDIADKQIVSEFSGFVEIIREKYRDLLFGIKNLEVDYKWSDKKEAQQKVQSLRESHYFNYLDMVMQAEVLTFIAAAISIKVAKFLGNDEDAKIFAERMNLDYWDNYIDQFYQIKHDVVKYLELEADSSWLQGRSIIALKKEQEKHFDSVEESMLNLQRQFECKTIQYIRVQKDGTIKKYISLSKV